MKSIAILAAACGSAAAFAPQQNAGVSTQLDAQMSESVPFLEYPKGLKGYVGDVGLDPLGFSEYFDMKWLREAELKHCRASMLATVGFVVQQFATIPGYTHVDDSNLAPTTVGISVMMQIVVGMGIIEWQTNQGNITMDTMFEDPKRVPGDIGFDPFGLSKKMSTEESEVMQLKELNNGRLAMLAIGGMIHHNWVTGDPLF